MHIFHWANSSFAYIKKSCIKGRSYWRRRRDITDGVESLVNEPMEQLDSAGDMYDSNTDQHATCRSAACESDIDVSEQYDVGNQSDSSSCSSDDILVKI